jgi:hypothetical protein
VIVIEHDSTISVTVRGARKHEGGRRTWKAQRA